MARVSVPGDEFQVNHRLVNAGETITFSLEGATAEDRFEIFPRYLERCDPAVARQSPVPLQWLDSLQSEPLPVANEIPYTPPAAGNYLARWTSQQHGVEYRYFAAIDQTYLIYRPAVWSWPTPFPATGGPEIHNGGLPLDWVIASTDHGKSDAAHLRNEQQVYGGGLAYGGVPSGAEGVTPEAVQAVREAVTEMRRQGLDVGRVANLWYGSRLSNTRLELARSAGFDVMDGYVPRASICGMGAPYYPFYISHTDHRFPSQEGPTDALSCVFDFTGSWHFHGPINFHRPSARGNWDRARQAIDLAAEEAVLTARNSGIHNFLTTLVNFESPLAWGEGAYQEIWDEERGRAFFEEYMHLLAFEHPRRWPIVFARAEDYADYFRAHYREMPRRVISSISHDLDYDRYWTDEWHEQRLMPVGYVPFNQNLRAFREARIMPQYNMPVSLEFINYNDNRRTCRFEYACPKPVHYYDLTGSSPWPLQPLETAVPDPALILRTQTSADAHEVTLELHADRPFPDYLLAIWDLPRELHDCPVETNATEFIWVENTDGNCRGIVRFDLQPRCTIRLRWQR